MQIDFLLSYGADSNDYAFAFPVYKRLRFLQELGYTIRIFLGARTPPVGGDMLIISSKYFIERYRAEIKNRYQFPDEVAYQQKCLEEINERRRRYDTIVFYDAQDSTGTIQDFFFDAVDAYAKNQLERERSVYQAPWIGFRRFIDRLCKDKYGEAPGVGQDIGRSKGLGEDQISKLVLGWNSSLAIYSRPRPLFKRYHYSCLRGRLPLPCFWGVPSVTAPARERPVAVTCRSSFKKRHRLYQDHRRPAVEAARRYGQSEGFLPRRAYFEELESSKVSIAPIGYGELTYRDYESIVSGAHIVKPCMSHIETFPNLYLANETYTPCAMSYEDIDDVLERVLHNERDRVMIAEHAQHHYLSYFEYGPNDKFCTHFSNMIGAILDLKRRQANRSTVQSVPAVLSA